MRIPDSQNPENTKKQHNQINLMKKTFLKTLPAIMLCFIGFSSCGVDDTAEDAVPRLKVDQNRVELIRTGTLSSGAAATLTITANKGYAVTSDAEWLSVDRPTGKGAVSVNILAQENESGAVRKGLLTVTSASNLSETITVIQNLEEERDGHMPVRRSHRARRQPGNRRCPQHLYMEICRQRLHQPAPDIPEPI